MFTGLYVMSASETGFTDAQVATWLQAAVTMAQRLQNKKLTLTDKPAGLPILLM